MDKLLVYKNGRLLTPVADYDLVGEFAVIKGRHRFTDNFTFVNMNTSEVVRMDGKRYIAKMVKVLDGDS
jgi:hypothetical protein